MNILRTLFFLIGFCVSSVAQAKVLLTLSDALAQEKKRVPGSEWKSENHYLTKAQLERAAATSEVKMNGALLVRHLLLGSNAKPLLFAYTDTHRVRSHAETVLVFINPDDSVKSVEVLQFDEPLEYLPKHQWFDAFTQSKLDSELILRRKIPLVTGASLSAKSVVEAVRRVLALHQVVNQPQVQGNQR